MNRYYSTGFMCIVSNLHVAEIGTVTFSNGGTEAQRVKKLDRVHEVGKWQTLDSDLGFLTLEPVLRTIISAGNYVFYIIN